MSRGRRRLIFALLLGGPSLVAVDRLVLSGGPAAASAADALIEKGIEAAVAGVVGEGGPSAGQIRDALASLSGAAAAPPGDINALFNAAGLAGVGAPVGPAARRARADLPVLSAVITGANAAAVLDGRVVRLGERRGAWRLDRVDAEGVDLIDPDDPTIRRHLPTPRPRP